MPLPQKLHRLKKRRERTLNVCLPHVIKDKKDVENLFIGNFYIKLPRQSSRSCHVVFANIEEKIMNQRLMKNKTVNGKRIIVSALRDIVITQKNETKRKKKKIFMPKITSDIEMTQKIFVANIEIGTKRDEIRGALPGCVSVTLLKPYNKKFRGAIAKMENIQIATEYLKKKHKWPIIRGHKVSLNPDTRRKHKKKTSTGILKIYDGTTEESVKKGDESIEESVKEECESSEENKNSDCTESNEESS